MLHQGVRGAGRHTVTWDGRDETGRGVSAGVYFARLIADDGAGRQATTQRLVLIR